MELEHEHSGSPTPQLDGKSRKKDRESPTHFTQTPRDESLGLRENLFDTQRQTFGHEEFKGSPGNRGRGSYGSYGSYGSRGRSSRNQSSSHSGFVARDEDDVIDYSMGRPQSNSTTFGQKLGYAASYLNPWAYGKSAPQSRELILARPIQQPGIFSRMCTAMANAGSATVAFIYKYTGAQFAWSWTGGAIQQRRLDAYDHQPDGSQAIADAIKDLIQACRDEMQVQGEIIRKSDLESCEEIDPDEQQGRIVNATIEAVNAAKTTKPRVFSVLSQMKADHKSDVIPLLHAINDIYYQQTTGNNKGINPTDLSFLKFACNLAQDFAMDFIYKQNYVMSSSAVVRRTLEVREIDAFARVSDEVDEKLSANEVYRTLMNEPNAKRLALQGNIAPNRHQYAARMPAYSLVNSNGKSSSVTSYEYQMTTKQGELFDKIRAEAAIRRPDFKASEEQQTSPHEDAVAEMAVLRGAIAQEIVTGGPGMNI